MATPAAQSDGPPLCAGGTSQLSLVQFGFTARGHGLCRRHSSFAAAVEKVKEHYGIAVCAGTVRSITEGHAASFGDELAAVARMPERGVHRMIGEMDGSFVPCVEIKENTGDRRQQRSCCWHEAKLCMAVVVGSTQRRFGATMQGVEQASRSALAARRHLCGRRSKHSGALCRRWRAVDRRASSSAVRRAGPLLGGLLSRLGVFGCCRRCDSQRAQSRVAQSATSEIEREPSGRSLGGISALARTGGSRRRSSAGQEM